MPKTKPHKTLQLTGSQCPCQLHDLAGCDLPPVEVGVVAFAAATQRWMVPSVPVRAHSVYADAVPR